jgi:hypothetical protein
VATALFSLDLRAIGSVHGPGPRPTTPTPSGLHVALLPPPPPIMLPPLPPPRLVPLPAPPVAVAPQPAGAAEVPVIPEAPAGGLLAVGLVAVTALARWRRR